MEPEKITILNLTEQELEQKIKRWFTEVLDQKKLMATKLPSDIGNIESAMEITGLKKPTIYALVSKKSIPFIKLGRLLRFSRTDLLFWMKEDRKGKKIPV